MRLLLDANLSPSLIDGLADAGFDALHVGDVELLTASDAAIVANLRGVVDDLDAGAIVSLSPTRLAVRRLPVEHDG